MNETIDDLLAEIRTVSNALDDETLTAKQRNRLEHQRDNLRRRAQELSLAGRHPQSVELQIESLERRRKEIESLFIKKGWSEKRLGRTIQDPSAYSHTINQQLAAKYGPELADIEEQLGALRGDRGDTREPGNDI